jgi:hypothetical protein
MNSISQDPNQQLIPFLRNLANSIESNELIPSQIKSIGEFFMSYKFKEESEKDRKNEEKKDKNYTKEDMVKFLSLGWYVYQILLENKTL